MLEMRWPSLLLLSLLFRDEQNTIFNLIIFLRWFALILVMLILGLGPVLALCGHITSKNINLQIHQEMKYDVVDAGHNEWWKKRGDANSVINNEWSTIWKVVYDLDHIFMSECVCMFQLSNAAEAIMIITIAQNLSKVENTANWFLFCVFFFCNRSFWLWIHAGELTKWICFVMFWLACASRVRMASVRVCVCVCECLCIGVAS